MWELLTVEHNWTWLRWASRGCSTARTGQSGQCQGLAGISHKEGQAGKPQACGLSITAVNREYIFIASFVQKKTLTSGFLNQTVVPPRSLSPLGLLMVPSVGLFLVTDYSLCPYMAEERGSWGLFYKGMNPIIGAPPSWLNHSQRPNMSPLGVRILTREFGGHKHSDHSMWCLHNVVTPADGGQPIASLTASTEEAPEVKPIHTSNMYKSPNDIRNITTMFQWK